MLNTKCIDNITLGELNKDVSHLKKQQHDLMKKLDKLLERSDPWVEFKKSRESLIQTIQELLPQDCSVAKSRGSMGSISLVSLYILFLTKFFKLLKSH